MFFLSSSSSSSSDDFRVLTGAFFEDLDFEPWFWLESLSSPSTDFSFFFKGAGISSSLSLESLLATAFFLGFVGDRDLDSTLVGCMNSLVGSVKFAVLKTLPPA